VQRRELKKDEVLWWESSVAQSIAVVESGQLGVRTQRGLIAVAFRRTVVGESSILTLDGPAATRKATVFALSDGAVATEYPAEQVKDAFGVGVPRLVLRTLFGQICSNSLLILGAHVGHATLESALMGLIQGMGQCEKQIKSIRDWPAFVAAFRMLYELREATDRTRDELVDTSRLEPATVERAATTARTLFGTGDVAEYLEQFIRTEADRGRSKG